MKTSKKIHFVILNILSGIVVLAIMHWTTPYEKIDMISKFYAIYCIASAFLIGIVGVIFLKNHFLTSALYTTLGFVLAILIRIIYDSSFIEMRDHSLAGIEFILIIIYVFPSSLIGGLIPALIFKFASKK